MKTAITKQGSATTARFPSATFPKKGSAGMSTGLSTAITKQGSAGASKGLPNVASVPTKRPNRNFEVMGKVSSGEQQAGVNTGSNFMRTGKLKTVKKPFKNSGNLSSQPSAFFGEV
jgi:hypothetical protein